MQGAEQNRDSHRRPGVVGTELLSDLGITESATRLVDQSKKSTYQSRPVTTLFMNPDFTVIKGQT